jgi:hypothetical protein
MDPPERSATKNPSSISAKGLRRRGLVYLRSNATPTRKGDKNDKNETEANGI